MNEMKIFENSEFGKVRTVVVGGEPWFVGKDVAMALGYVNSRKAIGDHVCKEDRGVTKCDTLGGTQEFGIINESGLYALIFGSKLPSAKRFKRWVTSEVLPAIRKSGSYGVQDDILMKMAELFSNTVKCFARTAEAMNKSAERMERSVEKLYHMQESQPLQPVKIGEGMLETVSYYGTCKLESFPSELREQVNQMLEQMLEQQTLNFSRVARYCTVNGFPITHPSVKTYYKKYFTDRE